MEEKIEQVNVIEKKSSFKQSKKKYLIEENVSSEYYKVFNYKEIKTEIDFTIYNVKIKKITNKNSNKKG